MDLSWERTIEILTLILENNFTKIIIGGLLILTLVFILQRIVKSLLAKATLIDGKESETITSLVTSIIKYLGSIGFILYSLSVFGIEVGSMLAGAGVLGIIIGFGAQNLVQDLLAGLFIVYEKQLQKGDFVSINSTHNGTVEEIGFRMLKIRDWSGSIISINNGQVQTVENYNKDKMRIIETITTSFYEDPSRVERVLQEACQELNSKLDTYLKRDLSGDPVEPFSYIGMASLNEQFRGYSYFITGLCEDLTFFATNREARGIIAKHLYRNNIKMPEQTIQLSEHQTKH